MTDYDDSIFKDDIEWLYEKGITKAPIDRYRPEDYVTRGEMAAFLHREYNVLRDIQTPTPEPEPEPEPPVVEPPANRLYIPIVEGPALGAAPDAEIIGGFTVAAGNTVRLVNKHIRGKIIVKGTLHVEDCTWDGLGGNVCCHAQGGKAYVRRSTVFNAEDGFKNSCDLEQVTVHKLAWSTGAHGDCVQAEGTSDIDARYSYFDAHFDNGNLANAAFMCKSDIASGDKQNIRIASSYVNGGNYTIKVNEGSKGGYPTVALQNVQFGPDHRYGETAGPIVWL